MEKRADLTSESTNIASKGCTYLVESLIETVLKGAELACCDAFSVARLLSSSMTYEAL